MTVYRRLSFAGSTSPYTVSLDNCLLFDAGSENARAYCAKVFNRVTNSTCRLLWPNGTTRRSVCTNAGLGIDGIVRPACDGGIADAAIRRPE